MPAFPLDSTERRADFPYFFAVQTRWNDTDAYRHVNNARYYAFFDTVIMHFLSVAGGFNVLDGAALPFTVENMCRFHQSLAFPDVVDCGLRVARLGNSSVRYEIGLFRAGSDAVAATGYFVDVFVDGATSKPIPIPAAIRAHLERAFREAPGG